ncbi:lysophospholipid acyltransferase family protein [Pleionea litopenaei]|uniref:Lysophospholipid acyltransferase family protein n=1 Tax=Pleionea litopenaei TaxID=3070815 RepID=A0AA51RVP7_9GAMM|nr:lysophospholipid acyltransferase family protein [Pleionea sp. HL-JVS1]WMS88370.1 lysophospholipid acyltransferase family protein [Pleionea sp. HL-JVS1]
MAVEWYVVIAVVASFGIFVAVGLMANKANWGFWLTNAIDGWIRIFCRGYHRLDGDNINLPENGGAIVIANHISGLDPFLLIASSHRPLRFLIAKEEYERFGLTWLFKLAKCIPVDRSGRVDKAFREVIRCVNQGDVVALFPHGKIHLDSEERVHIKPGLRKLVHKLSCTVYPSRIEGVRGQGSVFTGVVLRGRARLTSFPPFDAPQFETSDIDLEIGALLLGRKVVSE